MNEREYQRRFNAFNEAIEVFNNEASTSGYYPDCDPFSKKKGVWTVDWKKPIEVYSSKLNEIQRILCDKTYVNGDFFDWEKFLTYLASKEIENYLVDLLPMVTESWEEEMFDHVSYNTLEGCLVLKNQRKKPVEQFVWVDNVSVLCKRIMKDIVSKYITGGYPDECVDFFGKQAYYAYCRPNAEKAEMLTATMIVDSSHIFMGLMTYIIVRAVLNRRMSIVHEQKRMQTMEAEFRVKFPGFQNTLIKMNELLEGMQIGSVQGGGDNGAVLEATDKIHKRVEAQHEILYKIVVDQSNQIKELNEKVENLQSGLVDTVRSTIQRVYTQARGGKAQ
jgi:hypothetical protein